MAAPIEVTPPEPGTTAVIGDINLSRVLNGRRVVLNTAFLTGFANLSLGHDGPALPEQELNTSIGAATRASTVNR
ncbi:hypothetical protein K7G98_43155, partial [Saccharothrix sp. MB29]|nr:hypothetical protein [Saccharothrix sp. MB29]